MERRIGVRLPQWMMEALEAEVLKQRTDRPGVDFRLSDVVRELLAWAMSQKGLVEHAGPEK